jgi:hypothetical protein
MIYIFQAVPPPIMLAQLTHDSGKKQEKLDKYPMLWLQF